MALCQPSKRYQKFRVKRKKKKKEEKKVISSPLVMVAVLDGFQKDLSRRTWVIGICS